MDTWFGIATVPASVTQLLSAAEHFQARSDSPWETNTTGILSTQPDYMCSRALNISLCPDGPGGFTAVNGSEWMACNIDFNENTPTGWLNGADGAVKVLQDVPSAPSNISTYPANYTAGNLNGQWDGPVYYYLDNPFTPRNLDYKAKTVAIATQCAPITSRCLSNDTWPYFDHMDFSCSPAFTANFSFDGLSQGTDIEGGFYNVDLWNPVGMAFSQDAQLRTRVGARDSSLEQTPPAYGNLTGFEYLYPQNPLHFAVWAMGYPALPGKDLNASVMPPNTLLSDHEVYRYGRNGGAAWVLNCSATVYDVTYTFVNGSVSRFDRELASPSMGGFISAPWTVSLWNDLRINALAAAATAGSATATSAQLATMFADHWSRSALALSAGAMEARPNLLTQFRSVVGPLARVPKVPFWTLLALKAIYVIAVILLAIGAYCFTHPAETEVVKAQLSTKGLAAAHFDTPDILQSKVVGQLSERLQPATKDMQVDVSDDPARGGLKRAATFLGEMPDKKVGVVARADGAWRFAVVTNGVWNGIAPVAVDLVAMESKAGHLGDAGDLVKAWIK